MTFSSHGHLGATKFTDLVLDATINYLVTTANEELYGLEIDNSQNTVDVFVKVWDLDTGVDLGTTVPDFVFRVDAGKKVPLPLTGGDLSTDIGVTMATGIAIACVTAGGTGGSTSPTNDVIGTVITS